MIEAILLSLPFGYLVFCFISDKKQSLADLLYDGCIASAMIAIIALVCNVWRIC